MLQFTTLGEPLSDVDIRCSATGAPGDIQSIVEVLKTHNNRIFKATVISTLIVSLAALLNTYRLMKQLKRDEARRG
jgi:hypothetical protein